MFAKPGLYSKLSGPFEECTPSSLKLRGVAVKRLRSNMRAPYFVACCCQKDQGGPPSPFVSLSRADLSSLFSLAPAPQPRPPPGGGCAAPGGQRGRSPPPAAILGPARRGADRGLRSHRCSETETQPGFALISTKSHKKDQKAPVQGLPLLRVAA